MSRLISSYYQAVRARIVQDVEALEASDFEGTDADYWVEYYMGKYAFVPIQMKPEKPVLENRVEKFQKADLFSPRTVESTIALIGLPVEINVNMKDLLTMRGDTWIHVNYDWDYRDGCIFIESNPSPEAGEQAIESAKKNLGSINAGIVTGNSHLPELIRQQIEQRREKVGTRAQTLVDLASALGAELKTDGAAEPNKAGSQSTHVKGLPGNAVPKANSITAKGEEEAESHYKWDVFISHASEDKVKFVRELAAELKSRGLLIWYDEFTLTIGDSLRDSIDKGLAQSRYGVVVLSPHFFNKNWPKDELNGLFVRERNGEKVILPIWLDVDQDFLAKYSPIIADRIAAKSSDGMEKVISDLLAVIRTISDGAGKQYIDLEGRFITVEGEAILNFGKYSGRPLKEIAAEAPDYLEWILAMDFSPEVHEIVEKALLGVFPQIL
ncbi:TIR domain-containing protein [Chloroflexota bacterium]